METKIDTSNQDLFFETENTYWYFQGNKFSRSPSNGLRRPPLKVLEGILRDGTWVEFDGAWIVHGEGYQLLRVLPSGRPEGSVGIASGKITGIKALKQGEINE